MSRVWPGRPPTSTVRWSAIVAVTLAGVAELIVVRRSLSVATRPLSAGGSLVGFAPFEGSTRVIDRSRYSTVRRDVLVLGEGEERRWPTTVGAGYTEAVGQPPGTSSGAESNQRRLLSQLNTA